MDEDRTLHGLDFGFLSSFFHEKLFFPKFELLNSGCGLSASAAYLRVFTVIAEYRGEEFSSAVISYVALKEVAHGMVCLSESRRGVNFRDVICARRYSEHSCCERVLLLNVLSTSSFENTFGSVETIMTNIS